MRIAVFASGNGSNFTAIADAIRGEELKGATLALLFSDNAAESSVRSRTVERVGGTFDRADRFGRLYADRWTYVASRFSQ